MCGSGKNMHPTGKQLRLYLCDDGQDQGGGLRWGQEVGSAGVGWRDGEKRRTTVIE